MAKKYTCMAKIGQCSPPMGPFWECPKCTAKICNNCKARRGSNKCPICGKPVSMKKIQ